MTEKPPTRLSLAVLLFGLSLASSGIFAADAADNKGLNALIPVSPGRRAANTKSFPSDEALLSIFNQRRSTFDRLLEMVAQDMNTQSIVISSQLSDRLPAARRDEYRALLSSINPLLTVGVDYDGQVRFVFLVHGISDIGPESAKGIEYVPEGVRTGATSYLRNLDSPGNLPEGVYLRPLVPHWYIFFQRDN
jgi:hypothetical protein